MRKLAACLALACVVGCAMPRVGDLGAPIQEVQQYDTTIVFEGALTFSGDYLVWEARDEFKQLEESENRRATIDDAAFVIERFYRSQGFPLVRVEYQLSLGEPDAPEARILIEEGPRTRLAALDLRGNRQFSDAELEALLDTPEQDDVRWYVKDDVETLADAIELLYVTRGFAKVVVEPPMTEFSPDRTSATVVIAIEEGPTYRVGSIEYRGELGAGEQQLGGFRREALGKTYVPSLARGLLSNIVEVYGRLGFPDAKARLMEETLDEDGRADLVILVDPGMKVFIRDITVRGLDRVRESVVLKSVRLSPGQPYQVDRELETMRDLYKTGLFTSVRVLLEGEGDQRTLVIDIEEVRTRELYIEPGYGSYEKLRLGAGWRDRNLFGYGLNLTVEGVVSELAQRASISVGDPHFFDTDVEAAIAVFGGHRVEPSFESSEVGTSLSFSKRLSRTFELIGSYQFTRSNAYNVDPLTTPADSATVNVGSLIGTPRYDSRDDPIAPHAGTLAQVSLEVAPTAIGSSFDFFRAIWGLNHFVPFGANTTAGFSWRGGVIAPQDSSQVVPIQQRFFNGGENSVRCFMEDQLGPVDALDNPVGGEAFNIFTVELRQRIVGNLDGALFYDLGNVNEDYEDYLSFQDLEGGPGVGLRYMLPIGPIRLDTAWNPHPTGNNDEFVVHLSVGMSF